jgi:CxxC motif-containing protein (DUF1111 family)
MFRWEHGRWRTTLVLPILSCVIAFMSLPAVSQGNQRSPSSVDKALVDRGDLLFSTSLTPGQGLGPLFNNSSCIGCHSTPTKGGMGPKGLGTATRIGRLTPTGFDPMIGRGGPVARTRSVAERGLPCDIQPGIPLGANVTSVRNAPDLYGKGLIDLVPDQVIAAGARDKGEGVHGRVNWVEEKEGNKRVGRFGWKADTATLKQFVADAFRNELGITSPLAPVDIALSGQPGHHRCFGEGSGPEDDGTMIDAVTAFIASLPAPRANNGSSRGSILFSTIGCEACHTPNLPLGSQQLWLYSDLLIHDMGSELDDKVVQGLATGRDWRTTPLWGLSVRPRFLHDGRARTLMEAILAHGGEANSAKQRFLRLQPQDNDALILFLSNL